jgi:hydrogenase nickel incorporation protein HypB
MCTNCGCGDGQAKIEGDAMHEHVHVHADGTVHRHAHHHGHDHMHVHADGTVHSHAHDHGHAHDRDGDALHFGLGPAHAHAPGLSQARMVQIERDILAKNDDYARANRRYLAERGIFALNLVSSPGSGKTTLLVETIKRLAPELAIHVIEGDQQTTHDADRIRATGVPAIQVNTGKGCHLDAPMVAEAFARLPLHAHAHAHGPDHGDHGHGPDAARAPGALLFIENVGNLVCPAMWDLGEAAKVAILSVTEGEDKPLKYPDLFAAARLLVIHKTDLLPHVDFDVARCIAHAQRVNPGIEVLLLSSRSGIGMDAWLDWLLQPAA